MHLRLPDYHKEQLRTAVENTGAARERSAPVSFRWLLTDFAERSKINQEKCTEGQGFEDE